MDLLIGPFVHVSSAQDFISKFAMHFETEKSSFDPSPFTTKKHLVLLNSG